VPKFLDNLEPYWSNIVDLGSSIFRWRRVWTANLDVLTTATVPTPVNTTDATTKAYVDALFVAVAPTLREVDLAPALTGTTILEFDQADGFVLSNPGGTTARLDLAAIPVTLLSGSLTDLGSTLTGTLPVVDGGTGVGTFTDNGVLIGNGAGAIAVTAALTNGQLVIGSTGVDPVPASLTGTANQVVVTPGAGSITLSTPQDIAAASSPTFASPTVTTLNLTGAAPATPVANRVYTDSIIKAWVKFVGTGTPAITDDMNVSSIGDNGAGLYTINWATAFATANYAIAGMAGPDNGDAIISVRAGGLTTAALITVAAANTGTPTDQTEICVMAIGDQ